MKKHMKSLMISATILFTTSVAFGQKTYSLAFKPENGSKYDVVSSVKSKVAQNVMGQDMNINMNYDINMSYDILNEGANKKLQMTYDQLKMDMDVMGQKVTMNSDDADTSNDVNKGFRALKGQTISVTLNPQGQVVKVDGTEEILEKVGGNEMQKQTMEGVLGEDALKNMLNQAFGFYPKKPVKVGESWTDSITIKSPYTITSTNTYTLTKVEGKKAFINTVSTLKTAPGSKISSNGMEMTLDLSGDMSGTSEIDIETGMPMVSNARQNLKGNIEVQGQKVPMAMNMDINMTTQKK
ncbi:DUF6263 family protein [Niabella ginsengisoli]|uniref:DUF6263 family protein n=1 Tax=Niabella ginsengisoli TaxID=522298 RepID=A0ABS9SLX0_9BACT|nr:DUF6263 family protein [Niabella ginsengisoli]MCH5599367.1 DUF6263 family protein [Niabella ginsengisoli]